MEICRKFKWLKRVKIRSRHVPAVQISLCMQDAEKVAKHIAGFFSGINEENTSVVWGGCHFNKRKGSEEEREDTVSWKKKGDGRELEKTSYRQEIMKRMEGTLLICWNTRGKEKGKRCYMHVKLMYSNIIFMFFQLQSLSWYREDTLTMQ